MFSMKRNATFLYLSLIVCVFSLSSANAAVPANVQPLLVKFCGECHGEQSPEADVRLDTLASLEKAPLLNVLNKAESQLFFGMMPPAEAKQPTTEERQIILSWVQTELRLHKASALDQKARAPEAGNWIEHDRLFDGSVTEKPFSPARRWLVSPQIFQQRVYDIFNLVDQERARHFNGIHGLENPFTLPARSGVLYYDIGALEGGHLFSMLKNAEWISSKETGAIRVKHGEPEEKVFEGKQDRFLPWKSEFKSKSKPAFAPLETIVLKESPPTDAELIDAILFQFNRVLQRPPSNEELASYVELTRNAIDQAGNMEGLRQMLKAVLMESEFVYRLEFGAGESDAYGRKMLSPREASYAIAYALGDRGPDATLIAAAQEGRLSTKADYEREVKRLLADQNYFKGIIQSELSTNPYQPHVATHPKILRFFRDFFGYPLALKVFKDIERSDGYYENPGRGSAQTPGVLVKEADLFVKHILEKDQAVFENLLGSETYFVAPVEKGSEVMDGLNELYERFKDTDWRLAPKDERKPPSRLNAEELAFIRKRLEWNASERQLHIAMTHVEHFRKKGLNPHPVWNYPFGLHKLTPHANSYNISPPDWEYPREQPFKVPNRKGILTHPAWLIAHSANAATDPVRRGKWIREKLLAGSIPDVPITVDAKIPDVPHKTLGQRLDMVTNKQECWKCHLRMNPLGIPFEMYDDFGRFRTAESLEYPENVIAKATKKYSGDTYKSVPFSTAGSITGTGESTVDGEVKDALDMIGRLATSVRVRQSIIRHAFRFYMGRNEMLSDSQTLIAADNAYLQSGGSFNAVIVSLLTSDSFMYRK
jgi:Protein of unknown function (DUF1588)/Protein of unknown function (DUF1585)/Protein of unknown function (DUF1592)